MFDQFPNAFPSRPGAVQYRTLPMKDLFIMHLDDAVKCRI